MGEENGAHLEPQVEGPRSEDRAISEDENRNRPEREKNEWGVYGLVLCTQCFLDDFRVDF